MAYLIKTTVYNGYRCRCCISTTLSETWEQDKKKALSLVPTHYPEEEKEKEYSLKTIEVIEGESGKKVAWADLVWFPERDYSYETSFWEGYHPEHGDFSNSLNKKETLTKEEAFAEMLFQKNKKGLFESLHKIIREVEKIKGCGFSGDVELSPSGQLHIKIDIPPEVEVTEVKKILGLP